MRCKNCIILSLHIQHPLLNTTESWIDQTIFIVTAPTDDLQDYLWDHTNTIWPQKMIKYFLGMGQKTKPDQLSLWAF